MHFLKLPFFLRQIGIAPITVVTHHDKLKNKEDCDNAKYEASAATGSAPGHVFFVANYTKENSTRHPETERMTFDILHFALLSAERAVKIMKQKLKNEEEDRMMRALEGVSVKEQVAPDSADGKLVFWDASKPLSNVQLSLSSRPIAQRGFSPGEVLQRCTLQNTY